jgi:hypothetical protein
MSFLKPLEHRTSPTFTVLLAFLLLALSGTTPDAQSVYDVPNNNAGCPANCRQIPWRAGSDQWNGGTLPTYTPVSCPGLTQGDGTTDNTSAIQACINSAAANTAVLIPPGIYYVNGTLSLRSRVVLRGSGAGSPWLPTNNPAATTLKLGAGGRVRIGTGENNGSERAITGGYTKGSTTLTMAAGHGFVVGDWISIFEDGDPAIPTTVNGDNGTCDWCGENNGSNLIQQYAQVTGVSSNTITISRPLYYTYQAGFNPGAKKVTWSVTHAGIENLKLNGFSASRGAAFVDFEGALFSWVKNVETYNAPNQAKANHVNINWSHGVEVRDSYFHFGRDSSSDQNYGVAFFFWNSDHKIENNIMRHHRHSLSFEGGGSGVAILYNYIDDNYTDDPSYLGSARTNHGGHPMFNLYEGNSISHLEADDIWGSSSHMVFFRNWLRGGNGTAGVPSQPDWGFWAVHIDRLNHYYSVVGNVLGLPSWTSGTVRTTSSGGCGGARIAYRYGCSDVGYSTTPSTTSINHGNYDYITDGVAYWEGGSNHALKPSMYYTSRPAFMGSCAWPAFGPDLSPITNGLPAIDRFNGQAGCGGGPVPTQPAPPTNLRIIR